jgi:putative zinc finger/helix-turn-helix YgiT family protein
MKDSNENYRYDESGLDCVTLENITVYRCPNCGESEPVIPNTMALHGALAKITATKKERLTPKEIRFLRTHLGYSSTDFARKMGVSVQTVSRWERENEPLGMKSVAEKLLRIMTLVGDAVKQYHLEEMATEEPAATALRLRATRVGWAA